MLVVWIFKESGGRDRTNCGCRTLSNPILASFLGSHAGTCGEQEMRESLRAVPKAQSRWHLSVDVGEILCKALWRGTLVSSMSITRELKRTSLGRQGGLAGLPLIRTGLLYREGPQLVVLLEIMREGGCWLTP
ncbi:hypothetical protein LINPERPRIM_LOCUS15337 [Linum perenne]